MQKWEYLFIKRDRDWRAYATGSYFQPNEWQNSLYTSTGSQPFPYQGLSDALTKLGEQGWELVSVTPRSDYLGGHGYIGGATSITDDYAGFTSSEMWVFKRPKE